MPRFTSEFPFVHKLNCKIRFHKTTSLESYNYINYQTGRNFNVSVFSSSKFTLTKILNLIFHFRRIPVKITYKPTSEAEVNFNVVCRVKKKTTPLHINVKAQGFKVNMEVVCEDSNGAKVMLSQNGTNVINFGDVS